MPGKVPLCTNLISFRDDRYVLSGTNFITRGAVHRMIRTVGLDPEDKIREDVGCIETGDRAFVSPGTTIMHNVRIEDNAVAAARSVITGDIPFNSVAAAARQSDLRL